MKVALQRVTEARVDVNGGTIGKIAAGLLVFVCAERGDTDDQVRYFAEKIAKMRIFADSAGKTNLSILDVGGSALVISQFTLAAEWRKGNRPGFSRAEAPARAEQLFNHFCDVLRHSEVPVETGRFGADMQVSLVNDGPMTILMDDRD